MTSSFRRELLVPTSYGNRVHFPYLIVFREGQDSRPPVYFVTFGRNFSKFSDRTAEGFHILGHVKSREDATAIAKELNDGIGKGKRKKAGYQIAVTKDDRNLNSGKLWLPKAYRRK